LRRAKPALERRAKPALESAKLRARPPRRPRDDGWSRGVAASAGSRGCRPPSQRRA